MKHLMTAAVLAATLSGALAAGTGSALAAPEKYTLDPGHSQIVFSYNHLGFSTSYGMFSGFEGTIMFDKDKPANSSVDVAFPVRSMMTGWEKRYEHFMSDEFFDAGPDDMVTFKSTGIEVTGDKTANITGDLTMHGVTKSVVLDAQLTQETDNHPMNGKPWAGFTATTTLKRTDFGLGQYVPYVSDAVDVRISIEAGKADS